VADSIGRARHLDVAPNGDIYLKTRSKEGGIAALRDTTGDFRADVIERFSDMTKPGNGILWETGMAVHDGYIWASNTEAVYRWPMPEDGGLVPDGDPEIVVSGFPEQEAHDSKSITFDESGHLYVNVGAPSNACQEDSRTPGSPGRDPCPELERHAGIWRFDAGARRSTARWAWRRDRTARSISPTPKKAGSGVWSTPGTRMVVRPARSRPENHYAPSGDNSSSLRACIGSVAIPSTQLDSEPTMHTRPLGTSLFLALALLLMSIPHETSAQGPATTRSAATPSSSSGKETSSRSLRASNTGTARRPTPK